MRNLLRVLIIGLGVGFFIGYWLAQDQQKRKQQAASDAYANDPELQAIRKERVREEQLDRWLGELGVDDV